MIVSLFSPRFGVRWAFLCLHRTTHDKWELRGNNKGDHARSMYGGRPLMNSTLPPAANCSHVRLLLKYTSPLLNIGLFFKGDILDVGIIRQDPLWARSLKKMGRRGWELNELLVFQIQGENIMSRFWLLINLEMAIRQTKQLALLDACVSKSFESFLSNRCTAVKTHYNCSPWLHLSLNVRLFIFIFQRPETSWL